MTKTTKLVDIPWSLVEKINEYAKRFSVAQLSKETGVSKTTIYLIKAGRQDSTSRENLTALENLLNESYSENPTPASDAPAAPESPTCATCLNLCNLDNGIHYCEFLGKYVDPNLRCESHVPAPALDDVQEPRVRIKKTLQREITPPPAPEPEIKTKEGTDTLAACLHETWAALEEPDRCRLVAYALKIRSNYIPVK